MLGAQAQHLEELQARIPVPYNTEDPQHQARLAYPKTLDPINRTTRRVRIPYDTEDPQQQARLAYSKP